MDNFVLFSFLQKILDDLRKIENPDDSEIKAYITKLFKNGFQITSPNVNQSYLQPSPSTNLTNTPVKSTSSDLKVKQKTQLLYDQ
jgi:hypothetical protein